MTEQIGKYLRVIEVLPKTPTAKTKVWGVYSLRNEPLGKVQWFNSWRQYCFFPANRETVFNSGCLDDISKFMKEEMELRRTK